MQRDRYKKTETKRKADRLYDTHRQKRKMEKKN